MFIDQNKAKNKEIKAWTLTQISQVAQKLLKMDHIFKHKTIALLVRDKLEKKTQGNLQELARGDEFLDMTPKAWHI